jgi:hypothetical protein
MYMAGQRCGEERWTIEETPSGVVVTGEQEMVAPHPFPNVNAYRVTLGANWRPLGLEIQWTVGDRVLTALHRAEGGYWRVRIDYQGHVKEQEGDYPDACEVEFVTHLFNAFILARRDFALDGEHEFPVLRIGPPYMAVSPERMRYRCVEVGSFQTPVGPVKAKRYVVSLPPAPESEGYTFWADESGIVLQSYEGLDLERPWMRLVEYSRG